MEKKPNYAKMSLDEQLAAYNEMSETKRKSKFKSVADGAKALDREWARLHPPTKSEGSPRKRKAEASTIVVKTEENPKRKGSDAFDYYEAMRGGITVGAFLDKYADDPKKARDARLWLNYNVKAGHVELTA